MIRKYDSKRKINWALPNQTVTQTEFSEAIKEAEEGPFYTVQESMLHFEEWLSSRKRRKTSSITNVKINLIN